MSRDPVGDVDLPGFEVANVHLIAGKEIGQDCKVPIGSEIVRKKLAIGTDAEYIANDQDCLVRLVVPSSNICRNYIDKLIQIVTLKT